MTTRKLHPKEFKLDAISLVLEQGYSRAHAARSLEINPTCWGVGLKSMSRSMGRPSEGTAN